jgi:hypothetical protein
MAKHEGRYGHVKVGANSLANLSSWSFTQSAPVIDATVMEETFADKRVGIPENSGEFTAYWDPTDTAQAAFDVVGTQVTLQMYPDDDQSGDYYYQVTATLSEIGHSADVSGMVERSFSWVGQSAVTENTV